ncbi:restriction endonuclease subunit S [Latilactobacillus sakei]|uniref:restriction endonuclease subunit S n=1 Tax=Latilactobacillus sakei TaxID=1599 RepID=UPI0039B01D7E
MKLGNIFEKKNELNRNQFTENRTISIATMTFKPSGNGADENSIPKYKVLRLGDIAFEGHKNKDFAFGRFLMNDIGDGIISPRFTFLHAKEKLDIDFWKYYIHHESIMRTILVKSTKQGTMMNELVVTDFLKQGIKVPEKSEQKIIGIFLTRLDHTITLQQRKLELFKKLKQGYLQQMFPSKDQYIPRLRFKEFNGDWEQRKLDDVVEFYSGLTYSPDNVQEDGTFVLRSSNVKNGEIIDADNVYVSHEVVNSGNVQEGDVIVVVRNGSRDLIGKHAQIKRQMDNTVIGAFMTGVRSETPDFTNAMLDTQQFAVEINKNLGATINQITTGAFKKMQFVVPKDRDEREAIGTFFRSIDDTITLQQNEIEQLQQLKQAYLQKLFP